MTGPGVPASDSFPTSLPADGSALKRGGRSWFTLSTSREERFFLREKDSTLSFVLNGDAPVAEVSFFDFGRPRPGKRIR